MTPSFKQVLVHCLAPIAISAAVMSSGPAAAQDWVDELKDAAGLGDETGDLPESTLIDGLKEALRTGSERVVDQLGRKDGFNGDPEVRIPLPGTLRRAQSLLEEAGLGGYGEDLEIRLNRAAEKAVPEARDVFVQAIREMSVDEAREIVTGPDDAATRYFKQAMTPELRERMRPIVSDALSQVGAIEVYQRFTSQYQNLPLVPDIEANLADHTLDKALEGVFHYMAQEEAAIRNDPARRTTELLRKVFGGE